MNYIKADEVIDMVKNQLRGYFNANVVDTSFMYKEILLCLSDLGLKINPIKTEIIQLNHYKAKLPNDFYKLEKLHYCGEIQEVSKPQYQSYIISEERVEKIPLCSTMCDVCTDDCGQVYQLFRQIDERIFKYGVFLPMNVKASVMDKCSASCNSNNPIDTVNISNGYIISGIEVGELILEYISLMEENEDLIVPDNPKIIDFIKNHLVWKVFEYLMYNVDANVQGQLQYAMQQASITRDKAIRLARTPELTELYASLNIRRKRYNFQDYSIRNLKYTNYTNNLNTFGNGFSR